MTDENSSSTQDHRGGKGMQQNGVSGGIYGVAFIGAAVYFIQHATSFLAGVLGFFKALFWPGVLMYKALELLKM